jgi:hypothetical protein
MQLRTEKRIEELKKNWSADPCWNIEETEGFEAYKEELKTYRLQKELEWSEQYNNQLMLFAESIGLKDNLKLAEYIRSLQNRIYQLEQNTDR